MLTPEKEQGLRDLCQLFGSSGIGRIHAREVVPLLAEIDRLRAEVDSLRLQLHCELCDDTTELEDGRDCPRCKPDLSKALSLGK